MDISLIFSFLSELKKNNNREWFAQNKERYTEANESFHQFVSQLVTGIGYFDEAIGRLDPKKCVFRIYRDIRFSKDKSPYKTWFGASMRPEGRKSGFAGYYLSITPGSSLVAGGIWHPEPRNLGKIRQEIDYNPEELLKIINNATFKKEFGEVQGDELIRPPKGYDDDHENIDLLKHKDFIVYRNLKDSEVLKKNFHKKAIDIYKLIRPFNAYFNRSIS